MHTTTWFLIAFVVSFSIGQDSRPESKSAKPQADKEGVFRPAPSDKDSLALISLVKGKLVADWVSREKAKLLPKATGGQLSDKIDRALRSAAEPHALENDIPAVRGHIEKTGITHASGAHVLPLGRLEWEKPANLVEKGQNAKVPVVAVLVSTAGLPPGGVKGFRVKGEFQDKDGKRVVDFNEKSLAASPPNGVFLIAMPAGKALNGAPEFDGFQFKLTEVQVLK